MGVVKPIFIRFVLMSCQYENTFCHESLAKVRLLLICSKIDFSEIFLHMYVISFGLI